VLSGLAKSVNGRAGVTVSSPRTAIVPGFDINEFSQRRIDKTVAELVEERDAVKALGLVS